MQTQLKTKDDYRREALSRRDAMPESVRGSASRIICRNLAEDDLFQSARGVHVYKAIGSETDISPLIEIAWEMGKDVGMIVVQDDGSPRQLTITPATEFVRNAKLGIYEPLDSEPFDMELCDLVIVPFVAADENCNRLGYGKGYYDHFLCHFPRPAYGVGFEPQIFPKLPSNDLDVQMDAVFTEERVIAAVDY